MRRDLGFGNDCEPAQPHLTLQDQFVLIADNPTPSNCFVFSKIKETGFRYSLAILFNRLIPRCLFRCRRFLIFQLSAPTRQNRTGSHYTCVWSTGQTERQAASQLTGVEYPPAKARLATVFENGTLVAAVWLSPESFGELELGIRFHLNDDDFWLFSAYVVPAYRRRGIYRCLLRFVANSTYEENPKSRIWFAVNPDNLRSMKAHADFGVTPQARVKAFRLFNITYAGVVPLNESHVQTERSLTMHSQRNPLVVGLS